MQQQDFSVSHLMPHFSEVFSGNLSSSHGLSAAIVLFLLFVGFGFLAFALLKYRQAILQIDFYKGLLQGTSQDSLASRQREITLKALENTQYGQLWKEFDETLVHSADGTRLFNTLDAEHFFNSHTMARGLTDNRLLAAVPGFLTAIGVIGTFAGLQMGLASLELSQEAGVDALRQGIGHMISGASIAFLTSVWGVLTSVLFNLIEKVLERGVRKRIGELQNLIDYLYPRINAEQSLISIADHTRNSNDTLQGLAEKIGDRLQEAMVQASENIRTGLEDSLHQIMGPAIQSLVENAQTGSQQVLDSLLSRFLDGVGDAGNVQRQAMETASQNVNVALGDLGQQMSGFLTRLDEQTRQAEDAARERQFLLEKQLQSLGEQQTDRQKQLGEAFEGIFGNLVANLNQQQGAADLREKARAEQLEEQLRLVVSQSNQALDSVRAGVSRQLETQHERDEERQKLYSESLAGFEQSHIQLTGRLGSTFESMVSNLSARLEQQENVADQREKVRSEQLEDQLRLIVSRNNQAIDAIGTEVTKQIEVQQHRDDARQQAFSENVASLQQVQTKLTDRVENMLTHQHEIFEAVNRKMNGLHEQFSQLAEANTRAGGEVFRAAQQMQSATNHLGILSTNIKQAAEKLSNDVGRAAETTANLAEDNRSVSLSMQKTLEGYGRLSEEMDKIADKLKSATESAESGFSAVHQHLDSFKRSLKTHIEEVEDHVAKLLSDYAATVQTQTNTRMMEWNSQTNEYISMMTNAVRALSDVVDGMETKCSAA